MRASFLPGPEHHGRRQARPAEAARDRPHRGRGAGDRLRLHRAAAGKPGAAADISASANPKSSTGRLDIFTRVMTDRGQEFDKIPAGYHGPLYLEVSPRTFPIVARTGSRLSQIRFRTGNALLSEAELHDAASSRDAGRHRAAQHFRRRHRAVDRPRPATRTGWSAIAASTTPAWSMSTSAPRRTCSISGSRSTISGRRRTRARSRRVLHPRVARGGACAAALCRRDDAVRSAGRRIPRPLCRLLRSGLRPFVGRRHRQPRGARSAQPRSAVHPRARPDRRPPGLRAHAERGRRRSTAPTSAPTTRRRA